MEIGPTPCEEDCAQVGEHDFRQIRNSEHPNINQAIDLIKEIQKERKNHE